ncbi:MAG TPA: SgcJ/EcaC family oxidoreductase [Caulobacteraceae bacterium]|jgi:uncharacterized protein (TIGR02246 family)
MLAKIVAAALVFAALAAPVFAADEIPADARAAITAANTDWVAAMKARDAGRVVEPYADDGVFVLSDGKVVSGKANILAMERARLAGGSVLVGGGLVDDGVARADGDVYEWGHGDLTFRKPDGQTVTSRGRFLTVWRKSADGRWRIIRNLTF